MNTKTEKILCAKVVRNTRRELRNSGSGFRSAHVIENQLPGMTYGYDTACLAKTKHIQHSSTLDAHAMAITSVLILIPNVPHISDRVPS